MFGVTLSIVFTLSVLAAFFCAMIFLVGPAAPIPAIACATVVLTGITLYAAFVMGSYSTQRMVSYLNTVDLTKDEFLFEDLDSFKETIDRAENNEMMKKYS